MWLWKEEWSRYLSNIQAFAGCLYPSRCLQLPRKSLQTFSVTNRPQKVVAQPLPRIRPLCYSRHEGGTFVYAYPPRTAHALARDLLAMLSPAIAAWPRSIAHLWHHYSTVLIRPLPAFWWAASPLSMWETR